MIGLGLTPAVAVSDLMPCACHAMSRYIIDITDKSIRARRWLTLAYNCACVACI